MGLQLDYYLTNEIFIFILCQTYIGNVVISVNPYKQLTIYTPEKIAEYRNSIMYQLKPHM